MGRRLELSGDALRLLLYALQLAALLVALPAVVLGLGGVAGAVLGALFAVLLAATVVRLWRGPTDSDARAGPGTAEDITYDPVADPGQAAKERWQQAVHRLPNRDEGEE